MKLKTLLLTVAAVAGVTGAAAAQAGAGFDVSATPGQKSQARLGAPELRLSLNEAIRISLENNLLLEVSRLQLASSRFGIVSAAGVFDPYTTATLTESSQDTPATNQLVGAQVNEQRRRAWNFSLGQPLPTGGLFEVGWTNSRAQTNSSFYFLNPSYSSGLSFNLTQPLLEGFGTDINRAGIEVARRNRDISSSQFEQSVITTVQSVEGAYWDLVAVRQALDVARQSLSLAQDLLEQTKTRVRIGTAAPIDIVQSEATVAAREQDIILAENAVSDAEDTLKRLLGFQDIEDWRSTILPVDTLETAAHSVALDSAIEAALEKRPELRVQAARQEIGEISVLQARNATLPTLDLNVGYGLTGVGGTRTVRDQETGEVVTVMPGGWDDSLQQVTDLDYPQWSASLSFRYPLGRHQSKALLAQRRFDLTVARQNLALQRQSIIEDVRKAVRDIEAGERSIAAAVKARELAERNLDAEQKKFANGMSTNYQVLQIQEDLAQAQVTELRARVAYRIALLTYQVSTGTLLDTRSVRLIDQEPVREPNTFLSGPRMLKYGSWSRGEE